MREYMLVMLVAAAATYLLATIAREVAMRIGAVAQVRDRDVHAIPIPYFGGIAMLGGLVTAFLVALNLPFLSRAQELLQDAGYVLLGGLVICVVGVIDDVIELDWITKLAGQLLAAGVVVIGGVQFLWLPLPGSSPLLSLDPSQAALLTVLVIVATSNAVNFVDGLDGLAAGIVGIGAAAFFSFAYLVSVVNNLDRGTPAAFLTVALVGVCLGILPHNFYPARMFIGDAGAMLIGFILACSAITLTGNYPSVDIDRGIGGASASLLPALLPLVLPFAVLLVPFLDMGLAVVRRTRAGRSPFAPDKQHLHHRLLEIGHSHRRAVLLMYLWAAVVAGGTVMVSLFTGWQVLLGLGLMLLLALVLTFGLTWWRRDRSLLRG
ncbi:MAG: undecaprenyl/decaprenyl-phosphate alpha-N-acetylglucosaminyl 1-phosphate transferase [Propionibacteriales bacterium]|nr:undecaprenyl/decaprenyl-phosphate alpha-N-acetylglucosaminyl 1-phosphate transferase [Propionibacteriales bacterium]